MSKPDSESFWSEVFAVNLYKRSQGRLARQLTAAGLGVLLITGTYILSTGPLQGFSAGIRIGIPVLLTAAIGWTIFRLVNFPRFAEFLISVEGEMAKVSWASKKELYRATGVVLGTMFFLAIILLAFDGLWHWLLNKIGVLRF